MHQSGVIWTDGDVRQDVDVEARTPGDSEIDPTGSVVVVNRGWMTLDDEIKWWIEMVEVESKTESAFGCGTLADAEHITVAVGSGGLAFQRNGSVLAHMSVDQACHPSGAGRYQGVWPACLALMEPCSSQRTTEPGRTSL